VSIRETFHSLMPGDPGIGEPRRRVEQRLNATRGAGGGLLPALQALAQARDSAPGTSVQALNFHGGAVEMKLAAPDAASLDRLSQSLRSNGWTADLAGGNNAASGYVGSIQMRASGT
jgi:type II secretory pathway component PulL